MNSIQQRDVFIGLARRGRLGTPSNPNKGSTSKQAFWDCYFKLRQPAHFRRTMVYGAALAGNKWRRIVNGE